MVFSTQEDDQTNAELEFLTDGLSVELEKKVTSKLLRYLLLTQKRSLDHIQKAQSYEVDHYLKMDHYSKANLELSQSIRTGKKTWHAFVAFR